MMMVVVVVVGMMMVTGGSEVGLLMTIGTADVACAVASSDQPVGTCGEGSTIEVGRAEQIVIVHHQHMMHPGRGLHQQLQRRASFQQSADVLVLLESKRHYTSLEHPTDFMLADVNGGEQGATANTAIGAIARKQHGQSQNMWRHSLAERVKRRARQRQPRCR